MPAPTKAKPKPTFAQLHNMARKSIKEPQPRWQKSSLEIAVRRSPPRPSIVFDTYWQFAAERQSIFHARAAGKSAPWTQNRVLQEHKFTNAYRASDRVSQYLIRNVIYAGEHDWQSTLLRILLFKIFNKPATWDLLESQVGHISAASFSPDRVNKVLDQAIERGASIYSGAYIMPSGPSSIRQARKHVMHVTLLANIARGTLARDLQAANSMERAYHLLLGVPSFGPFLAFQFLIDANYSPFLNFSEMDFVVPGPGARDGIRKCFIDLGDYDVDETIRWVADRQEQEFEARGLHFQTLWGRALQLIDCQNLFCEVDKYARAVHPEIKGISGRTRIKQRFSPSPERIIPWFPPKWGLNARIEADLGSARPFARIS
jgi:hypothetical protein